MERHAQQAAIPEVVHIGPEVGKNRWGRILEIVEDFDEAAFFSDEDSIIRRKLDDCRLDETAYSGPILQSGVAVVNDQITDPTHDVAGQVARAGQGGGVGLIAVQIVCAAERRSKRWGFLVNVPVRSGWTNREASA